MRFDNYVVTVVANGTTLPEVQHLHRTYVVAKPGSEFMVHVQRENTDTAHTTHVKITLEMDGRCVGFTKIVPRGARATFEGFALPGSATGAFRYASFKFAASSTGGEGPSQTITNLDQLRNGKMLVKCYNCRPTTRPVSTVVRGADTSKQTDPKLPEGKKWFLAPSLATEAGAVKYGSNWSKTEHETVGPAFLELELHYETATTLLLRKVLDPSRPAHKAILQQYGDDTALALVKPEPAPAAAPAAAARQQPSRPPQAAAPAESVASAAAPAARRKRPAAAAVKEEGSSAAAAKRQQQQQQGPALVVDLTRPATMPATRVGGREVQRDEVAVCDLTGGDEGAGAAGAAAGQWKVEKRPVEELL